MTADSKAVVPAEDQSPAQLWVDPSTTSRGRRYAIVALFLIVAALLCQSASVRVGDGSEYMAMAHAFATGHDPVLSPSEMTQDLAFRNGLGQSFANIVLIIKPLQNSHGGQNFPHFWMYSLLASPGVFIAMAIHIHPNWGFAALNTLLFLLVGWLAFRRLGAALTILLLLSPIIWWLDKAHTEMFTFSLIAITFLLLEKQPWWSILCLGLASTQNPPIALLIPIVVVTAVIRDRDRMRMKRLWGAIAAAGFLSLLHPLFYENQLGVITPQVKLGVVSFHIPSMARLLAPVFDLNIGLFPRFPMLGIALVIATIVIIRKGWKNLLSLELGAALVTAIVLLISFGQTAQIQSGGTPGIARYALWLIPLLIPLFAIARKLDLRHLTVFVFPVAIVSALLAFATYAPVHVERYLTPSRIAAFVWNHFPQFDNPVAVIFFERIAHREDSPKPIGTPTCSKILLVGGLGPPTCPIPQPTPKKCSTTPITYCYANRIGNEYEFSDAPP